MNRITSLVAVLGFALAGAACQSSGTDWSAQNNGPFDQNTSAASNESNSALDQNSRSAEARDKVPLNNSGTQNPSDMGNLGHPDGSDTANER